MIAATPERLALFDIDCTLIDSHGCGLRAIEKAMSVVYGTYGPIDGYSLHGRTDPQIIRELVVAGGIAPEVVEAGLDECLDAYVRCLRAEVANGVIDVLPGVRELIPVLAADERALVGLLTGNVIAGAGVKLGPTGIAGHFRVGAYGSDSGHRPDLADVALRRAADLVGHEFRGKEIAIIGDTPADITCGAAHGVKAIAVATGRHTRDDLAAYDPDYLFDDLSDVPAVVAAILA